ncbi:MAG: MFS transporter, partial [Lacrimispora sphenoides]
MKKLSWKVILGYGTASASDAITYNFVFMFLLFFLTDIAGINPALAGSISLIAVIWDAVSTPILGQISDNTRSKYGRRRPYLAAVAIPLAAAFVLLFTDVPLEGGGKNVYYIIMAMIFWTSYTTFYIPYTALGAELTLDYDERTKLRAPATIFNLLGNIIGMSAPPLMVGVFISQGMAPGRAWQMMALVAGCVSMICIFITWRATRGHEIMDSRPMDQPPVEKENGLKTYLKIIRLKPYKYLLGTFMAFMFGYSMVNADVAYFVYHKMQSTEQTLSLVMFIYILIGIVMVPLVSLLSLKIGKKATVAFCIGGSGLLMLCFKFISIDSVAMLLLYM